MKDKYPNFLPQWTKAVEHFYRENSPNIDSSDIITFTLREYGLDWYSSTCCFTGEAFFHKESRGCGVCDSFTYNCGRCFGSVIKLHKFKNELAKHLQIVHPEIWQEWKSFGLCV